MGNLLVGNIYRIRAYSTYANQVGINRFYLRINITTPAFSEQNFLDSWGSAVLPLIATGMASDALVYGADMEDVTHSTVPVGVNTVSGQTTGTGLAPALPGQVSGIVSLHGDFVGRSFQGRRYIPFPSIDSNDFAAGGLAARPTGAYLTAMGALGTEVSGLSVYVNGGQSATVQNGFFDERGHTNFRNIANSFTPDRWATQRRRGDYGRPNTVPF